MKKTILLAVVMFFALSVSAFAQGASFTAAAEVIDRAACCGLAEPVGAIQFTIVPSSPASVTGSLTLRYSLPIANFQTSLPAINQVVVTGGILASAGNDPITGNGIVVISVPAGLTTGNVVRISNVRVNVSANCGISPVTASAASAGNFITNGETSMTVLNGIAPALLTPTVTASALDASNGIPTPANVVINVQEGFLNAFGVTPATDPSQTVAHIIRLTLSGTFSTGVTLTFPATTGLFTRSDSAGVLAATPLAVTSTLTPVYYVLTTDSNPAIQETFSVTVAVSAVGPYPLAPGAISVSAHIGPINIVSTTVFPRYTGNCETSSTQFLTISGALSTTLLIPYATEQTSYSTGLAVANTTLDPGTTAMGFLKAIPQTGKLTVYFYPNNATTIAPWVSTTSGLGLFGLDAAGKLPPGGLFAAMLSQLLPASAVPFSGYIFIITDFTNAHGEYFISDFDNFTHGALMLVVNNALVSTTTGRTVSEGLNN